MSKKLRVASPLVIGSLAVLGLAATRLYAGAERETSVHARAFARTSPVRGLVLARPFALEEPYLHVWRAEQPLVLRGWLLVLDVDPQYVEARQMAMPVLVLGDQTVECMNFGTESGRIVVLVPAGMDERGAPTLDLAVAPAWFGAPELPERVDAAWIAAERARIRPDELATFTAAEVESARAGGGATLEVPSRVELDREAARLILAHSPRERELADGLLVPVTK